MPSAFDLLQPLDDEPRTPSTVDVRRAIADGRRRRRTVRFVGYTGVAAVTALALAGASVAAGRHGTDATPDAAATGRPKTTVSSSTKPQYTIPGTAGWTPPPATAPTSCSLTRLPTPDNVPMALVSGADPTGRYLVGRSYPGGNGYQAVIWHDGKAQKVMLPGNLEESLRDVNSAGTAVGWSYVGGSEADTGPVPYVFRDGKVSKLPGVRRGTAEAINDAGAIVGNDEDGAVLVWPSATAKPIRLPLPAGGSQARAADIDEDGTVVGNIDVNRAYVWFADGTHRDLPKPVIDGKQAVNARVFNIRNGWATGMVDLVAPERKGSKVLSSADPSGSAASGRNGGQSRAVQWNVRTGEVRVFDEFDKFGADAINAQGWQVGIDQQGRAVLLAGAAPVVLPGLTNDPSKAPLSDIANALSDDGRVIGGQSDDAAGTIRAVVWHCR